MYQEHFGLDELPFGLTPDTEYAYACSTQQQALNMLLVALKNGEGFVKVTGEVGSGKTMLCRAFLSALDESHVYAYIPYPCVSVRTLLLTLANDLEVTLPAEPDEHQLISALTQALLALVAEGRTAVLCLDEAQAMPIETLEALRLFTNLETEKRKLLQVVLFGQRELDTKLEHESVRQLRQRITFHTALAPLTRNELTHYLAHRLRVAGYRGDRVFSPAAVHRLHRSSHGLPRLVNIIAHKSLMLAYGRGTRTVDAHDVALAIRDTPAAVRPTLWQRCGYAMLGISAVGLTCLAFL